MMTKRQFELLEVLAKVLRVVTVGPDNPELWRSQLRQAKSDLTRSIDALINESIQ